MITEMFVEGRRVDGSAEISSLLTFAIDDIKDFSSRQTTFSKTVVLPGTGNNNDLFGNIFDAGTSNLYNPALANIGYNFNASKSAKCIIFQDNFQTFKGTMRLLQIDSIKGRIEYQVALNGDLTTLNVALTKGFLSSLDFSAYNVTYNLANIRASWDAAPGSGVFFPMIDYGTYSASKHDWDIRTFRPALYAKEYVDKMFAAANFRYECNLFNTDRFKGLIVPHNQKVLQSLVLQVASAAITAPQDMITHSVSSRVVWDTVIAGGFSYAAGVFTYTQATALNTTISWKLTGTRFSDVAGTFVIQIRKNGAPIAVSDPIATFPALSFYSYTSSAAVTLTTGDTIDFFYQYLTGSNMHVTIDNSVPGYSTFTMTSGAPIFQPVDVNQTITINDSIPQNIRQIDFLVSLVKLSNLYVYEDQFDDRLIHIKPFINFFEQGNGSVIDLTYKMNRSEPISIKPMSEVNSKIYNFNYASDSDYYNDLYQKRYNRGYGSFIFDSQFEFATETNTLELIFAPTPLVGYVGEDKVYPTIFKRTGNINGQGEETVDSVIRIMQTQKITGVSSWSVKNETAVLGSQTYYGYAGHYDDPYNPSNDLNFGGLNEVFFQLKNGVLDRTQFNVYWSAYMDEITDKDSKLLTAKFYLTPTDIFHLDFSKFVYLDGVLWRLNKITDYNTSMPGDCTVELLNVIRTAYSFPVGATVVDDYALQWNDLDAIDWEDPDPLVFANEEVTYK